jgi:hypothetical protein
VHTSRQLPTRNIKTVCYATNRHHPRRSYSASAETADNNLKAPGPDYLKPLVLRELANEVAPAVTYPPLQSFSETDEVWWRSLLNGKKQTLQPTTQPHPKRSGGGQVTLYLWTSEEPTACHHSAMTLHLWRMSLPTNPPCRQSLMSLNLCDVPMATNFFPTANVSQMQYECSD